MTQEYSGAWVSAADVTVTRSLLGRHIDIVQVIADAVETPPTEVELATERAARQQSWDENHAKGLVGIANRSDYDCHSPDWVRPKRGDVIDKWIPWTLWTQYIKAVGHLRDVEEDIDLI
jgi:hypothetical protein